MLYLKSKRSLPLTFTHTHTHTHTPQSLSLSLSRSLSLSPFSLSFSLSNTHTHTAQTHTLTHACTHFQLMYSLRALMINAGHLFVCCSRRRCSNGWWCTTHPLSPTGN